MDLVRRRFSGCDVVLVEGYKTLPIPRVEVTRTGISRPDVAGAVARVSDGPAADAGPTYGFEDLDGIASAVLRLAGLDRGSDG